MCLYVPVYIYIYTFNICISNAVARQGDTLGTVWLLNVAPVVPRATIMCLWGALLGLLGIKAIKGVRAGQCWPVLARV